MMSEAERQYYLGRVGVHLWYARAPLPGAAPSPEFRFPLDDSTPEPESDRIVTRSSQPSARRSVSDGAAKDRLAGLQALMANTKSETHEDTGTVVPEEPVDTDAVESPTAVADVLLPKDLSAVSDTAAEPDMQGKIDAHLGFWVSEHFVLVSNVSEEASEQLQNTLAENILASIGGSIVKEAIHIRWPVFGNPRVPGNSIDDFGQVLRSVSKGFGSRKLLLLGVLPDDMPSGRSEWLVTALGASCVDFPRSLAELAAAPAYKRELWQQLKVAVGV
ncbi:hypothetical protein [Marinobacter sp. ATCH36]|uniref:hypothetical protein n=1 Tax=Marinobacter sp. ATCH36 TaxID=2945106 RepID=UPI00202128E1|nr:hypothetical protein [Marinobacter sp. ATCH36]MCL7944484.1 hypothetical protein [Marinobacter sp. ATCH36]